MMFLYCVAAALIAATVLLALGTVWMKKKVNRAKREETTKERELPSPVPFPLKIETRKSHPIHVEHRINKAELLGETLDVETMTKYHLAQQLVEVLLNSGTVVFSRIDDFALDCVRIRASLVVLVPEGADG